MSSTAVASGSWTALLSQPIESSKRRHLVQFYEDEHFLYEAVTLFVAPGLKHGDGVIVIATRPHCAAFEKRLEAQGFDVQSIKAQGQLAMRDAADTLSQFMVRGIPDAEKFISVVGGLIDKMGEQYSKIRIYGEMVDLLWAEGNLHGTIELEELWNGLAQTHCFTLLCGYGMGNFSQHLHGNAFHKVCRTHSHVIPAEGFVALKDPELQRRMIASLQQQAKALQTEIAGRKEIEQALQQALHLRDEFLSIAGHELMTPLTSLKLQIQILQRAIDKGYGPEVAERVKRAVENSDYQSKRLSKLIDQLLDLTRIRLGRLTLEPVELDLAELTQDVISRLGDETILGEQSSAARASITIHGKGPLLGCWDQARIEQVITNLVTNAVKYGEGKPIEVRLSLDESRSEARLVVRDYGIGIRPEDQARIFRRFERASSANQYPGLGLGLYIVRQIVDAHGGAIDVQSQPNEGSSFTVALPLRISRREKTIHGVIDHEAGCHRRG